MPPEREHLITEVDVEVMPTTELIANTRSRAIEIYFHPTNVTARRSVKYQEWTADQVADEAERNIRAEIRQDQIDLNAFLLGACVGKGAETTESVLYLLGFAPKVHDDDNWDGFRCKTFELWAGTNGLQKYISVMLKTDQEWEPRDYDPD